MAREIPMDETARLLKSTTPKEREQIKKVLKRARDALNKQLQ